MVVGAWVQALAVQALVVALAGSALGEVTSPGILSAEGDPGAGSVRLSWRADGPAPPEPLEFELQQAPTSGFASSIVRYQGHQRATVLTGMLDGEYWFRFRARVPGHTNKYGPWSKPARFTVKHHSTTTAATLFGLGAVVFTATALFLWSEDRRQRHATPPDSATTPNSRA